MLILFWYFSSRVLEKSDFLSGRSSGGFQKLIWSGGDSMLEYVSLRWLQRLQSETIA